MVKKQQLILTGISIAGKKKKIDRRIEPPDTFLEENHPMTISSKFCSY